MGRTARRIEGLNTSARITDTDSTRVHVGRHRLRGNTGSGTGNAAGLEGLNGVGNEALVEGLDEIESEPGEMEHDQSEGTDANPLSDTFILEEDEKIEAGVPVTGNTGVIPEGEKEPKTEDVIRQDESLEILEGMKENEPKSEEEEEREGEIILENRDPDSVIDELDRTQSRMISLNDRKREGFARTGDRQDENIAVQTGNELRRINQSMLQTGPGTGTISSFRADDIFEEDVQSEAPNLGTMQARLFNADNKLKGIITSVVTEAKLASAPGPVRSFMVRLSETGLNAVERLINSYDDRTEAGKTPPLHEVLSLDEIRSARQSLQSDLDGISRDYAVLFGSDKRLYIPFMDFMTVLQLTIKQMDNIYEERMKIEGAGERNGDLGTIAKAFFSDKKKIEFEDSTGTIVAMNLTPSQYETYIQVFKDPLTALRKMQRYASIANKRESDRTDDEKTEYREMQKYSNLFSDFEKAHRYMLERETFSQQDIDYAFGLRKREMPIGVIGDIFQYSSSAGGIYQMVILEKVFGGMREAYLREAADGGISENALLELQKAPPETGGLQAWFKAYIKGCIERNPDRFRMILQGLVNVNDPNDGISPMDRLGMMLKDYIIRTFRNGRGNAKVSIAAKGDMAGDVWDILFYTDEAFRSYIQEMIPEKKS